MIFDYLVSQPEPLPVVVSRKLLLCLEESFNPCLSILTNKYKQIQKNDKNLTDNLSYDIMSCKRKEEPKLLLNVVSVKSIIN